MVEAFLLAPARMVGPLALLVALGAGCGPAKEAEVDTDTDGSGSSTGRTTGGAVSASGAMTAGLDTTAAMDDAEDDADSMPMETTDDEGGSFIDMPTGGDDGGPQPLGEMCNGPDDCVSGFCYSVPMIGSSCSECLTDSDCEMGTCALDFAAGYAVCTDGGVGVMCDSDEGCGGELVCAELINTGGAFPANFCSECDADTPCGDPQVCSPVYDLGMFQGSLQCLDPGSVLDGGGCPIGAMGGDGTVCESGFCGVASVFMFVELGVCGECVVDEDCGDPKLTCTPASAGMGGLMPAVCG